MSQDAGELPAGRPATGLDPEELVAEADERVEEVEAEFGPDALPRGALPGNPQAVEDPS
jgi:hypothetical protein